MLRAGRNRIGLTPAQIEYCRRAWSVLCGDRDFELDVSDAPQGGTRTRFNEGRQLVFLGADAYPGDGLDANSRMSTLACLAHELAHFERFESGYDRPIELPDRLIDEAETCLRASFFPVLNRKDREDLVEDARDHLMDWLVKWQEEGTQNED